MRFIPLTRGKVAIIDDTDYAKVSQYRWFAHCDRGGRWCAIANSLNRTTIYMHRFLLGLTDTRQQVDHINGDALDNRRDNMRIATVAENNRNNRGRKTKSLQFKGIYFLKDRNKYRAQIGVNGKIKNLGQFNTPEEAARIYDDAAMRLHGEFARTNTSMKTTRHDLREANSKMEVKPNVMAYQP